MSEVTLPLFGQDTRTEALGPQAFLMRGLALPYVTELSIALAGIESISPFRHMVTPGGFTMSVALTNCGRLGWTTDAHGYRYTTIDPTTQAPWPAMPDALLRLADEAATRAGFGSFRPDACLINRYLPGARLTLHQDKDEIDFSAPIVSISLGVAARFLFGGTSRSERPTKVRLLHGDVVVWGGVDRLRFHGVMPLEQDMHDLLGAQRINFTLRKAG